MTPKLIHLQSDKHIECVALLVVIQFLVNEDMILIYIHRKETATKNDAAKERTTPSGEAKKPTRRWEPSSTYSAYILFDGQVSLLRSLRSSR